MGNPFQQQTQYAPQQQQENPMLQQLMARIGQLEGMIRQQGQAGGQRRGAPSDDYDTFPAEGGRPAGYVDARGQNQVGRRPQQGGGQQRPPQGGAPKTRAEFIDQTYRQYLGRAASPEEMAGYTAFGPDQIVAVVSRSQEAQNAARTGKNAYGEPFGGPQATHQGQFSGGGAARPRSGQTIQYNGDVYATAAAKGVTMHPGMEAAWARAFADEARYSDPNYWDQNPNTPGGSLNLAHKRTWDQRARTLSPENYARLYAEDSVNQQAIAGGLMNYGPDGRPDGTVGARTYAEQQAMTKAFAASGYPVPGLPGYAAAPTAPNSYGIQFGSGYGDNAKFNPDGSPAYYNMQKAVDDIRSGGGAYNPPPPSSVSYEDNSSYSPPASYATYESPPPSAPIYEPPPSNAYEPPPSDAYAPPPDEEEEP